MGRKKGKERTWSVKKKNEQAEQKSKRDKGDTYIPIDTISRKETVKEREREISEIKQNEEWRGGIDRRYGGKKNGLKKQTKRVNKDR